MSAEGDDRCRNGGGSGPEEERAELLETFGKMYTEDKKKLLDTITELMGEGHTAGGKAVLLERVVTASLMSKKPADEEEASMELLSDEDNGSVGDFEEVGIDSTRDFRNFQFKALKELRKDMFKLKKTVKKGGNASGHKLRYVDTRRYCAVCPIVNPSEEDERQTQKSTSLVCVTCKVAVCTGALCLMAHMCEGKGKPMTRKAWGKLDEREDQGGHKAVPSRSYVTEVHPEANM